MSTSARSCLCTSDPDRPHDICMALPPRIELHGRVYLRHLKCPHRRADAVAEMAALAWRRRLGLAQRGKDVTHVSSAIAACAARAVRNGRRVCGRENGKDALSPLAQARHGFAVSSIPDGSSLHGNIFDNALADNTVTPVDDQGAFRLDFPMRLQTCDDRRRRVILGLMVGERTLDFSQKCGVSPGRVSQMRRRFQHGPAPADA